LIGLAWLSGIISIITDVFKPDISDVLDSRRPSSSKRGGLRDSLRLKKDSLRLENGETKNGFATLTESVSGMALVENIEL